MTQPKNKRASGRTYALKPTQLEIRGQRYRLNDISAQGIGLIMEKTRQPSFFIGQRIEAIPIQQARKTQWISGVVAHISTHADRCVCGIRFQFTRPEQFEHVKAFVAERTVASSE